ncbi:MAG: type II toxin-antitoxin system RelE/ParE family toxin [Tepidisphaeraceae bacterium]|jgi:hypothetical protein
MTCTLHPEARLEYLESARYYEQCRAGLGVYFSLEVEAALQRITEAPGRWPILEEDVRRCLTHIFPYGIVYTIGRDSILVLAVMHCSRKPRYWKHRQHLS